MIMFLKHSETFECTQNFLTKISNELRKDCNEDKSNEQLQRYLHKFLYWENTSSQIELLLVDKTICKHKILFDLRPYLFGCYIYLCT